jgi:hypothetical protein
MDDASLIPLWVKVAYTAATAVILATYALRHPPDNFLWFSDIAMILTVPAIWLEHRLLISMIALAVLLPHIGWNVSYFWQLTTGRQITTITDYMFDASLPRYLRALSLFHVYKPPLLLYLVYTLGYDPRALPAATLLCWVVLVVTYRVTDPALNINLVFRPPGTAALGLSTRTGVVLMMLGVPLLIYVPTHWLLMVLR